MLTKTAWLKSVEGKKIDCDGVPSNQPFQCVDEVKDYFNRCFGIKNFTFSTGNNPHGYARGIWENFNDYPQLKGKFIRLRNTASFVPAKGDVMVWSDAVGTAGHVAVCTGKNTGTSKFQSMDQNWGGKYYCTLITHSYNGVYGVLRPLYKCTTADLNVRSGPGTDYTVVDELEKGTLVKLLGYNGSWAKIGDGRWVSANYLD